MPLGRPEYEAKPDHSEVKVSGWCSIASYTNSVLVLTNHNITIFVGGGVFGFANRYHWVYQLCRDFPDLSFSLNGIVLSNRIS